MNSLTSALVGTTTRTVAPSSVTVNSERVTFCRAGAVKREGSVSVNSRSVWSDVSDTTDASVTVSKDSAASSTESGWWSRVEKNRRYVPSVEGMVPS